MTGDGLMSLAPTNGATAEAVVTRNRSDDSVCLLPGSKTSAGLVNGLSLGQTLEVPGQSASAGLVGSKVITGQEISSGGGRSLQEAGMQGVEFSERIGLRSPLRRV